MRERYTRLARIGMAAASMLVLAACASGGRDLPRAGGLPPPVVSDPAPIVSGTMRPYQIRGRWYHPAHQPNYDQVGQASWYGPGFDGRPTSTGERFDQNALTAAHTTLPLPGLVEVTNLANGRSVVVRINDRGPFVDGRIIDLSRGAAEALDMVRQGVGQVRVRYLGPAPRGGGGGGYAGIQTASVQTAPTPAAPVQSVSFEAVPVQAPTTAVASAGIYWIQAGPFADQGAARAAANRLGDRARVASTHVNGQKLWRVMLGPWGDPNQAEQARRGVIAHGFTGAAIVGG